MMMLDSGMVRSRVASRSTGNLPSGEMARKAARELSSARSTMCGSNGVSFSYSAMSTFQQYDARGWR